MIRRTSSAPRDEGQYCISEPDKKAIPWIINHRAFRTKNSTTPRKITNATLSLQLQLAAELCWVAAPQQNPKHTMTTMMPK